MTADFKEYYDGFVNRPKGDPPYPILNENDPKLIEKTDACVKSGGDFHVSISNCNEFYVV